jgi:hypothetical protein
MTSVSASYDAEGVHVGVEIEMSKKEEALLALLAGARDHLDNDDYHVQSKVSPEVLAYFEQGAKENGSWKATPENAKELLLLAQEFELDSLIADCKAVLGQ